MFDSDEVYPSLWLVKLLAKRLKIDRGISHKSVLHMIAKAYGFNSYESMYLLVYKDKVNEKCNE